MKKTILNRSLTNKLNWCLDNLLPPVLRDSKFFMGILMQPLFGSKKEMFMEFKPKAPFLTKGEYSRYYSELDDVHIDRETHLNQSSVERILNSIDGGTVLDVGSGRGYLAARIARERNAEVTGIDIQIPDELRKSTNPRFTVGDTESLPFADRTFDTVVCTHTIEHVMHPEKAVSELRRVAKKQVIIVVPRQREYLYSFDLHLSFFPYEFSLHRLMRNPEAKVEVIGNDWFYSEEVKNN